MKKLFLALMLGALLSGCAAIDFLDGKYYDDTTRDDIPQQQYNGGTACGGGHSH